MSTSNLRRKIIWLVLLIVTINFTLSFVRQLYKYKNLVLLVKERQEQKKKLEEENVRLVKQLELVESPEFLKEETAKLLGYSVKKEDEEQSGKSGAINQILQNKIPNYEKWWRLFVH